ncbi:MAG: hypothetical protein M3Z23_12255 [Acidobacteriota bacterium]|nr:hypothetical protein [Acidobacteriota bacterium]
MRRVQLLKLMLAICFTVVGSAKTFPLTASSIVPATRGKAEIGKDRNKNTEVKLSVEHLAPPDNLTPPKETYVVWIQEKGSDPENRGQLKVNKKLQAKFQTVTPKTNFDIFVTAEPDANGKAPSGPEVLRATIQP